jgi:transcriptional regulator with XRE-family HTH domain
MQKLKTKAKTEFNEIIGKLIRERRKELNLSPVNLAKYLNINYRTYSQYETGKISIPAEKLFSLAKLFAVSVDEWLNVYYKNACMSVDYEIVNEIICEHNKHDSNNLNEPYPDSLIELKINILKEIYKSGDNKLIKFLDNFLDFLHSLLQKDKK